ncbi:MAG: DUF11 domain-containing protein [Nitratireductor rhodophyticola]|uniref:DUF11 domain-containing protein n=1 Tax=Nitratireductor rhodophyticola TaxID=2854036 RepID=UPI0032D94FED
MNLTHNSTSMAGGVGKLPYSAVPDNDTSEFQEPHELYVYDGGDYGATAGQRPSGVAPETYVELGTCAEGRSLALRQDDTCSLTIAGLPDIGVTASPASAVFTGYDEPQTLTMTATNFGPGATGADGYTMVTTLPSGWSVHGALPANCAASGQLVTCALDPSPLSGSGSPGSAGGTISFDIPVSVSYPTPGGVQSFTVALGRSTPDNDGNPANVDYDNSNDTVVGSFDFQPSPASLAEPDKTVVDANGNGVAEPGEQLTYTITLTNNGSTDATNVSISDDLDPNTTYQTSDNAGSHSGGSPGGTVSWSNKTVPAKVGSTPGTLVLTTVVTVVDPLPPGGRISNAAYETGSTPPDCSTNPTPSSCAVLSAAASLVVETVGVLNDANGNGFADAGETIGYTYTVSNTGGLDISGITIDDPNLSVSGGPISLAANASDSSAFSATYTLTVADIDAGRFETQATVRGTASDGSNVTDLSDDPSDPTNTDLEGDGEPDDPNVFTFAHSPSYDFVKEAVHDDANGNGFADAGEVINYTFTVENTGNVTLSDVAVTDTKATISGSPIATLAPGEIDTSSVTGVYTITQADVDAGTVDNVAAATAKDPGGNDVERQSRPPSGNPGDATSQPMAQNGDYDFVKEAAHVDANGNNLIDAGEIINYTFTVENTGNVTLTDIEVTDSRATVSGSPLAGPLAPGAVDATSVTGTYTVVQADIDAGNLDNVAASTATLPDGSEIAKQSRPVDGVEGDPTAPPGGVDTVSDYDFVKEAVHDDANGNGFADAGEVINYTFTVENTGNVTLSDVAVTDTKATISGSPIATLAPGEIDTSSVTGVYTITQADVDAGTVDNVAAATAKDPGGNDVERQSRPPSGNPGDATSQPMAQNGDYDFVKEAAHVDANGNNLIDAGEIINYTFTVENTGNVTLTDIEVTDSRATVSGSPLAGPLAPGAVDTTSVTGTYTVVQADIDAGNLDNVAASTATLPDGSEIAKQSRPVDGVEGDPTAPPGGVDTVSDYDFVKEAVHDDANGNGFADAGEVINYTFTVENTGNVTLSDVAVTDTKATISGSPIATLAPGEIDTSSVTGVYTITQADVDAGTVDNVAAATAKDPGGNDVERQSRPPSGSPGDATSQPMAQNGDYDFVKEAAHVDANGNNLIDAGEIINYTFTVENTGNVTLTDIEVTDSRATVSGSPLAGPLAPGAVDATSVTGTYTVVQADIDAGNLDNVAASTATLPDGSEIAKQSRPVDGVEGDPTAPPGGVDTVSDYDFVKEAVHDDANGNGFADAGEVINYTFTVENTGNVTLSDVAVTDTKATISGSPIATLAPGEIDTSSVTGVYTITQADVDAGTVDNVAAATAKDPGGNDVERQSRPPSGSPGDATSQPMAQNGDYDFVKEAAHVDANGNNLIDAGEIINYTFTVENTGNVTLTDIEVTDSRATVSGSPLAGPLAPGAVDATSVTGTYTVVQADIDAGNLDNVAASTATLPDGSEIAKQSRPVDGVEGDPTAPPGGVDTVSDYDFVKEAVHDDANGNGFADAGEVINYTFTVENTGNVTLSDVAVTDTKATISGSPIATLAPGEIDTSSVTGVYTITQADVDAGTVDNVAAATAKDPGGNDVERQSRPPSGSPGDATSQPMAQNGDYDFVKEAAHVDANGNNLIDAGEIINYTFTVENTGNVTLTDIEVTDSRATVSGSPLAGPLAPGAVDATSVTGTYTVVQADIDAGNLDNVAASTATLPDGSEIAKQSRPVDGVEGDPTAPPGGVDTVSDYDFVKEAVHDDANGNGFADAGEVINYTFTVENTGNVTLSDVAVTDTKATISGSPIATLAPGEIDTSSVTGVYTITQADVDAGTVDNVAAATAKDPGGNDVERQSRPPSGSPGDATSQPMAQNGDYDFVKEAAHVDANGNNLIDAGEIINYTFTVENTGNVTLTDIEVTDSRATVSGSPLAGPLAPGAVDATSVTGTYTVVQADIDAGNLDNVAASTATLPDGSEIAKQSRPVDGVEGDPTAPPGGVDTVSDYDFVKEAVHDDANGNGFADAGEVINYTFTVENTGNVTLSDVAVTDTKATISGSPIATLAPGEIDTSSVTGVYTITQADVDAGTVDNVAAATAKDPGGNDVERQSRPPSGSPGDATSQPMAQNGDYDFVKEAAHVDANGNNLIDAGEIINYTFTVENTGNVTLTDIEVTDSRATVSGSPLAGPLAPGAVDATSVTGTYTVVQADIDAGNLDNVAASTATLPDGSEIAKQSRPVDGVEGDPTAPPGGVDTVSDYDFVKEAVHDDANGNGFADAGEVINYTFTVENTGNVTLSDVAVTDTKATISGSPIATLAPGEIDTSVTGIHTITQDDIDAGSFSNSATAVGKNPKGEDVPKEARPSDGSPGDPTVITFEANPSIEVDLSDEWIDMNANGYPDPGEPVVYSFVVRNTGNVTLEDVTITELDEEAMDGKTPEGSVPVSGGAIAHLAPGSEDNSLPAASYPLKPSDIDAGGLVATADVAGHTRAGVDVIDDSDDPGEMANIDLEGDGEPDDPTRTLLPHHAALGLEKMGAFQGATGRLAQPGDTILYTLTATNEGNVTISDVKPVDSGPRFGGRQGSGTLSSFSPSSVDLVAGTSETFTATYTVTQGDIDAAQGIEDGIQNTATISGTEPRGQAVTSPEAEASVDLPGYAINKVTPLAEVRRGGRVPYTISVKMLGSLEARPVNIVDMTPPGLTYVRGSAQLDGSSVTPKVEGRKLTFENLTLSPDVPVLIDLELAVTSAAKPGEYTNQAWVEDLLGERISRNATATVEVVVEAVFDCGDILGKVFDDKNRNGYQDAGEPGLPGVRVATVKGLLLTADDNGRFHVACADLPDQRIGTNYIMKLDPRSLPSGYRLTTENPRVVRLTAGKASEFQFGASIGRVVRLDLTDAAFVQGAQQLRPEWETQIAQMIALLDKEPSVLRLVYAEGGEGKRLAKKRINALRKLIASEWRVVGGRYRLEIETRLGTEAVSGSNRVKALE